MELIAAVLLAGPLGYFARTRAQGLTFYLAAWAVIFPIQTVVVFSEGNGDNDDPLYWVFNALILCLGIGLNTLGARLRQRRLYAKEA
jgi:peptidoglycan/LPS O-acetylase OafA/YrhL